MIQSAHFVGIHPDNSVLPVTSYVTSNMMFGGNNGNAFIILIFPQETVKLELVVKI